MSQDKRGFIGGMVRVIEEKRKLQAVKSFLIKMACEALDENLVGIYLHGSLALGGFSWETSDLDVIIVVRNSLLIKEKTSLAKNFLRLQQLSPRKGVEISVILKNDCQNFVYPTPYELHYSMEYEQLLKHSIDQFIAESSGVDEDLAAHFSVIYNRGIVLYGEAIKDVFAPVPRQLYVASVLNDIDCSEDELLESSAYYVLNFCRVLALLEDGIIVSKIEGGEWGLTHLSPQYTELISIALQEKKESAKNRTINSDDVKQFKDYVQLRISQNKG